MEFVFPTNGKEARTPKGNLIQGWGEGAGLYITIGMAFHNGIDITPATGYGEDILAPHSGRICEVRFDGQGYGNQVDIISPIENGIAYRSTLAHMTEQRLVKVGDYVIAGQVIGKMGNSGFTVSQGVKHWGGSNPDGRGTHLHWTLKKLRAVKYGEPSNMSLFGQDYLILNRDNGVNGAIDPLPFLKDFFMTNSLIVQNGAEFGIYDPATSEDGLITLMRNRGMEVPLTPEGKLDWSKIKVAKQLT